MHSNPLSPPIHLACNGLEGHGVTDESQPRLSWQLQDSRRGARQTAWQVQVATSAKSLTTTPDLWDSGEVRSDQSVAVPYAGQALVSRQACFWRVRVWDQQGQVGPWSDVASWEMGLLEAKDWQAKWIGAPPSGHPTGEEPVRLLRTTFGVESEIVRARIYVTARGLFELSLNGQKVGRDLLTPGWTNYRVRNQYLVYDVTEILRCGKNALGLELAHGWFCGHLTWLPKNKNHYGEHPSALVQLEVLHSDGTRQVVSSDATWRSGVGPILSSSLYHGESYDARLEMKGWNTPTFDDHAWAPVQVMDPPSGKLLVKRCPPIRAVDELKAVTLTQPKPGVTIFDLGQNMVGWVRLRIQEPAGAKITLRFGEMLDRDGDLYTENLRSARAMDEYLCQGGGAPEVWEPKFTFHGFRYVEVSGHSRPLDQAAVVGVVLNTDLPVTGTFECSSPDLNRLQQNILWGQKSNFLDVPTDCPQRDERLGWTGDAQVFVRTAAFNMNVASFFEKWMDDLTDDQRPSGAFPHVAPDVLSDGNENSSGSAAWSDAGVICPWEVYRVSGDPTILRRHYDAMARWIDFQEKTSRGLVRPVGGFGDWLAIDAVEAWRAPTPRDLIGTAYFAHTTGIMQRVAILLGRADDAKRYQRLREQIGQAFNRAFVTPEGRVVGHTQTGYLLALGFDLLPETLRARALDQLVALFEQAGWHLSTGFVGTPLIGPVLTRFGRTDVACRVVMQKDYPGWLYSIEQGATTMWERWNSFSKKNGFGDAGMNSFNHYAYGAVGEWLYESVAGLSCATEGAGYRRISIRPEPIPSLIWARAELRSMHGPIASSWKWAHGEFVLNVRIPPNTSAEIRIPSSQPRSVTLDGRPLEGDAVAQEVRFLMDVACCQLASGEYEFRSQLERQA